MSKNSTAAQWVLSHRWAITEEYLQTILGIAHRQITIDDAVRRAIAAKDGEPLANTRRTEIRDGVAIIPVIGPIFPRANIFTAFSGGTSIGLLAKDFTIALENRDVKSIVFNIDSPGGEVTGVSEFADMIYNAREIKPIVAYVYGYGASAAYWIASSASKVIAANTAEVGSIGVVSAWEDSREKDKKDGVQTIEIVSSFSPNKRPDPQTDSGKAQILKIVDDLALEFIGAVARNRGISTDTVMKDFGQGDVFVGRSAVAVRMIDEVGTLEGVIASEAGESARPMMTAKGNPAPQIAVQKPYMVASDNIPLQIAQLKAENPKLYDAIFNAGKHVSLMQKDLDEYMHSKEVGYRQVMASVQTPLQSRKPAATDDSVVDAAVARANAARTRR